MTALTETKHKHTAGPWHISGSDVVNPQGYIVARSMYSTVNGKPTDETLANARLIAAAPKLLEALRGYLLAAKETMTASEHMQVFEEHEEALMAAVARAEGRD